MLLDSVDQFELDSVLLSVRDREELVHDIVVFLEVFDSILFRETHQKVEQFILRRECIHQNQEEQLSVLKDIDIRFLHYHILL